MSFDNNFNKFHYDMFFTDARSIPWTLQLMPNGDVHVVSERGTAGVIRLKVWFDVAAEMIDAPLLQASSSARRDGFGDVILLRDEQCTFEKFFERLRKLHELIEFSDALHCICPPLPELPLPLSQLPPPPVSAV